MTTQTSTNNVREYGITITIAKTYEEQPLTYSETEGVELLVRSLHAGAEINLGKTTGLRVCTLYVTNGGKPYYRKATTAEQAVIDQGTQRDGGCEPGGVSIIGPNIDDTYNSNVLSNLRVIHAQEYLHGWESGCHVSEWRGGTHSMYDSRFRRVERRGSAKVRRMLATALNYAPPSGHRWRVVDTGSRWALEAVPGNGHNPYPTTIRTTEELLAQGYVMIDGELTRPTALDNEPISAAKGGVNLPAIEKMNRKIERAKNPPPPAPRPAKKRKKKRTAPNSAV